MPHASATRLRELYTFAAELFDLDYVEFRVAPEKGRRSEKQSLDSLVEDADLQVRTCYMD